MKGLLGIACGAALALQLGASTEASAFCGFFVSGADASLTNSASQVVLLRKGTRPYNGGRAAPMLGRRAAGRPTLPSAPR